LRPPVFQTLTLFSFQRSFASVLAKIPFQPPACQEAKFSTALKTTHSNHYRVCGNRFFRLSTSNPCSVSNTAEKLDPSKKTPTDYRKIS